MWSFDIHINGDNINIIWNIAIACGAVCKEDIISLL